MAETIVGPYETMADEEIVDQFYIYYLGDRNHEEGKKISPTGKPGKEGPYGTREEAENRVEVVRKQLTEREKVESAWTSAGEVEVARHVRTHPEALKAIWIDHYQNGRLVSTGDPCKKKAEAS